MKISAISNKRAFTLAEVVMATAVGSITLGAGLYGYALSAKRAEWAGYSLAAHSLALQGIEQARAAKWDPWGTPPVDQVVSTNFPVRTNVLDIPISGTNIVWATNYTTITVVSTAPAIKMIKVDTVWNFMKRGLTPTPLRLIEDPTNEIAFSKSVAAKAFTLTEMMVTAALGVMVIGGTLTLQLVGARMFQFTQTKLGGNDDARSAIAKLVQDVRTAKLVKLGQGDLSGFTPVGVNSLQQGNAIEIYPNGNTNNFIRYFRHSDNRLRRTTNGSTASLVLANFVTNNLVFTSEDFQGAVLTNNENNRVIGLTLQFYQIQYPIVKIGANQLYDFYQVRTKITRRTLE